MHAPLIIDVPGLTLTKLDRKRLKHPLVGGLILFARNWQDRAQLTALCRDIKKVRSDLLICVDHEGGRVQRFKTDGFTHLPPMRAFGEPGSVVASSEPSFAMIPIFAQMNGLRYVGVTERADHQPDLDALLAANPRILYLCSPNNPTGALLERETLERAVREAPGVVFVDEAYAEFSGVSAVDLAMRVDNLLVIRTMSKAFGLAGLRIGYAIGAPALVRDVEKSRGPYKLSSVAEQMALAALRHDMDWVQAHVALAVENRNRLAAALRARGYTPLDSRANYVCVPVANAVTVGQALRARGVAARPFVGLPHVGDTLRISVGPWELVERFLEAFDAATAEVNGDMNA